MDEQAKSLRVKLTMLFNSLPSHQKHEYHQLTEQMDGQETQCLEVGKQTQIKLFTREEGAMTTEAQDAQGPEGLGKSFVSRCLQSISK